MGIMLYFFLYKERKKWKNYLAKRIMEIEEYTFSLLINYILFSNQFTQIFFNN
jgi:hypothetical protein